MKTDPNIRFPYVSGAVTLDNFTEADISDNYLDSLNDKNHVRHSQQRLIDHSVASCKEYILSEKRSGNLFLAARFSGKHVANIGVKVDYVNRLANVSIFVFKSFAGSGFGSVVFSAAVEMCCEAGFFQKIEAGTMASNGAMLTLMKKAGMQEDGVRKNHLLGDGKFEDCVFYAIILS